MKANTTQPNVIPINSNMFLAQRKSFECHESQHRNIDLWVMAGASNYMNASSRADGAEK